MPIPPKKRVYTENGLFSLVLLRLQCAARWSHSHQCRSELRVVVGRVGRRGVTVCPACPCFVCAFKTNPLPENKSTNITNLEIRKRLSWRMG